MTRLISILGLLFVTVQLAPGAEAPAAQFAVLGEDLVAPATVHVHAVNTPLAHGDLMTARYDWDFGDPGARFNTLRGFCAAHTFDHPGSYVITLRVTDESGRGQTLSRAIHVRKSPGRAIYVSQKGSDANDGASPATAMRSMARALSVARDRDRILLRRGDTFGVTTTLRPTQRNLVIGAYGTTGEDVIRLAHLRVPTNNPRLLWAGPRNGSPIVETSTRSQNVVIQDITLDTVFTGDREKKNVPAAVRPTGVNLTLRRCVLLNVSDGINANAAPTGVLMQDCIAPLATGLRSYLAWVEGSDQAYLGNVAVNSTREAVLRMSNGGASRVLIAHNDLTNLDRTSVDRIDTAKNALTVHFGSHIYIRGNSLRGGPTMIGPLGERDGLKQNASKLQWVVFEQNLVSQAGLRVNHGMQKLMIRHNRFRSDDSWAINVEGFNREYNRRSSDVMIVNNTAVNRGSKGNFLRVGGGVSGLHVVRNVYVAPQLAPGSDLTAIVYVGQKDAHGISSMTENIWPAAKPKPFAAGGAFYVWPTWSDARGYIDLAKWNRLNNGTDRQLELAVDVSNWLLPESAAVTAAGARRD
ncbi:MAG TPA: PKD domain-containing protein [Tepidisphaeraceae bacterium]|nr:PKD domain-containing protein [Tepidisphaeraceae bacterium]